MERKYKAKDREEEEKRSKMDTENQWKNGNKTVKSRDKVQIARNP